MYYNIGGLWQFGQNLTIPAKAGVEGSMLRDAWFAVENGRIAAIGLRSDSSLIKYESEAQAAQMSFAKYDLGGRWVLPGLIDSHIHVTLMGECASQCDLSEATTVADICNRLRDFKTTKLASKTSSWLIGRCFDHEKLEEKRFPTRKELDEVSLDQPIFLWRACWHVAVVNTKAFEVCNIPIAKSPTLLDHSNTGGYIEYDTNGIATGKVTEDACAVFAIKLRVNDTDGRSAQIETGLDECIANGLTMVQTNCDRSSWRLYAGLDSAGKIKNRVCLTPMYDEIASNDKAQTNKVPAPGTQSSSGLLRVDRVKIMSDGSLGASTAALRVPYVQNETTESSVGADSDASTKSGYRGLLLQTQEELNEMVKDANGQGYRLEIHAIGDRAAESVLDAYDAAKLGPKDRPIITHAQILGEDLLSRIAKIGAICDVQPSFTHTDARWVAKRVPASIHPYSYCWKTMMKLGIVVAGGSDSPIEHCSPIRGMYDAIFRDFLPNEALSFPEALSIYTVNGAYAAQLENVTGQLKCGLEADFVVVNKNIAQTPALMENPTGLVAAVAVKGNLIYDTCGILRNKSRSKRKVSSVNAEVDASTFHKPGTRRKYNCPCCSGDGFFGKKSFGFF